MQKPFIVLCLIFLFVHFSFAQDPSPVSQDIRQSYSGKFGFYNPSEGLNNGLMFGVDGITEFLHYNLLLSAAVDLYPKQAINIFRDPQPSVSQQSIVLLPIHASLGYKLLELSKADTRFYAGLGGGYYLYFYSVEYRSSSGGLLGTTLTTKSDSKNGGNIFGTIYARALIGKVFVESRFYLGSESSDRIETHQIAVDPSGFAITLGIQY